MKTPRDTCIEHARRDIQDCLVVGAGINGSVAAAALAGKGAKVTLIDKADFASVTSQESSNLAWGGIKYLEKFEFPLVWNLCASRNELMDAYPTQVREIRFFTSIAKNFRLPRFVVYLGTLVYWLMGRCRTKPPRLLSIATIKKEAPHVRTEALAGGFEYSDCYFVENDTRFTFGFVRKVLKKGCNAINYMELIAAEFKNGLWECALRDHVSGDALSVRAKTMVNAAGPFADRINTLLRIQSPFQHVFSKGAHIIVPRVARVERVLTFFASDGRLFFMIPMDDRTCIGTTDTRVDGETARISDDDVDFLLENANALLTLEQPITRADVIAKRCGVRPLVVKKEANVGNAEWTALSRKHEVDVHPEKNYCSVYGGKLTDCINVGEEIAGIVESFGIAMFQTLDSWYGEPSIQKRNRFESECARVGLEADAAARLWRRHGTAAFQCIESIRQDATMAEKLIGDYTRAEIHLIASNEMVIRLEDFLRRRTWLALTQHKAALRCDPGLPETTKILFGKRADEEIARYFD